MYGRYSGCCKWGFLLEEEIWDLAAVLPILWSPRHAFSNIKGDEGEVPPQDQHFYNLQISKLLGENECSRMQQSQMVDNAFWGECVAYAEWREHKGWD